MKRKQARTTINWLFSKIRKRIINSICRRLYKDTNRDTKSSIIIAGVARSGTTWLAEIICSQIPARIMFEPFHSRKVPDFRQFHYFQYMNPNEVNDQLESYCQRILSGSIRHAWIDRQVEHIFPTCRVIKEIRANLFLKWIHHRFPEIPILFILRHPCAVVLSRMELNWSTDTDIESFLDQERLTKDILSNKMDLIRGAKTAEEKHAIIWCISNLVPIKQFHSEELDIFFYENLIIQPEIEIPRIFNRIGQEYSESVFKKMEIFSTTTMPNSAIVTGENQLTHWSKELSSGQIQSILSIVESFGLDHIYGDAITPRA